MAPEQQEGKEHGKEVDLWAYGILLFELFAGYNPFEDKDDPQKTYSNVAKGNINWAPYMSTESKEFIEKLLLIEPKKRMKISEFSGEPLFLGTDWDGIKGMKVAPPYIPELKSPFDTSYIKKYADRQKSERKRVDLEAYYREKPMKKADMDLFAEF
eukprot:TRINITY_DN1878_c0_g1_i18.p1 TRINITY_DN1878_c0_g1~~TRINITY_DN1878_c0_g1_i18.p1  ORF type:complete len:156 (-),score=29.32 TRINITY_DN1878_c0_g1_i18:104-571(-)